MTIGRILKKNCSWGPGRSEASEARNSLRKAPSKKEIQSLACHRIAEGNFHYYLI